MSQKKVTPSIAAKIKARRAQGAGIADISREFRLGVGTVHRTLATGTDRKAAPPAGLESAPAPEAPVVIPTRDELLLYLAAQASSLRADVKGAADAPARAAANRNLIAVQALITKLVPQPNSQPDGTFVSGDDMQALAAEGRERFEHLVDELFRDQASWPRCPSCGQTKPTADLAQRMKETPR